MTATQAKNWNDLSNLMDVANLSQTDNDCLNEIQSILNKYDLTQKFGVALLHKHFEIAEDEMLIERTYLKDKRLETKPEKLGDSNPEDFITTMWRFDKEQRYGCSVCSRLPLCRLSCEGQQLELSLNPFIHSF